MMMMMMFRHWIQSKVHDLTIGTDEKKEREIESGNSNLSVSRNVDDGDDDDVKG